MNPTPAHVRELAHLQRRAAAVADRLLRPNDGRRAGLIRCQVAALRQDAHDEESHDVR